MFGHSVILYLIWHILFIGKLSVEYALPWNLVCISLLGWKDKRMDGKARENDTKNIHENFMLYCNFVIFLSSPHIFLPILRVYLWGKETRKEIKWNKVTERFLKYFEQWACCMHFPSIKLCKSFPYFVLQYTLVLD